MPKDSNPQSDEKNDASEAFTLLTTPRQRGYLTPYQRFPLILQLTSTSFSPNEYISTASPLPRSFPSQAEVTPYAHRCHCFALL